MKITNKSIKILSPAKYPAAGLELMQATFDTKITGPILNEDYEVRSPMNPNSRNIQEKLQFYHVKTSKKGADMDLARNMPTTGLGKWPPAHVNSVNALLVFNTKENPYENYKTVDNLVLHQAAPTVVEDVDGPDAAPETIHNKQATNKSFLDQIVYAPELIGAPTLDFPDLIDLPGIASDISFYTQDNDAQQVISPSYSIKQMLSGGSPAQQPEVKKVEVDTPEQKVPEVVQRQVVEEKSPITEKKNDIPSPPPPPPPAMPVSVEIKSVVPPPPLPPVSSDARSDLLAAIRTAGGTKKLRAVDERDQSGAAAPVKKSAAPALDLMSDLHNKLQLRRKGISGAKDQGTSVMTKISSMIPPPPPKQQHNSSNSEESEDPENDWE
jgi:WAS protein family homolog 1